MCADAEFVVIMTTAANETDADRLAGLLVERRLAACVQQVPVRSVYRWEGKIERDAEALLLVKTRAALASDVMAAIRAEHSYEVPEIIGLSIEAGDDAYLDWIQASTGDVSIPETPGS